MLKVRKLGIDACQETVAYLARRCEHYRAQEFMALARIEIWGGGRRVGIGLWRHEIVCKRRNRGHVLKFGAGCGRLV